MRSVNKLLSLCFLFLVLHSAAESEMNDRIITLNNDTIYCYIPNNPKQVFREPRKTVVYGYDYVVAKFAGDSVRFYNPGSIKGYIKKVTIKGHEQTEWYFSDSVEVGYNVWFQKRHYKRPLFLRRLVNGSPFQLWFFEDYDVPSTNDRIFVLRDLPHKKESYFLRVRQLWSIIGTWSGCNPKDPRYKHWFTGPQYVVMDYNKSHHTAGKP
ncbi:MAG TPA: hypothetical protein PK798_13030 [Flavobacteriales bacterium]|nr:hypothetical protein [Flavobacteriales bacterium]HRJ39706.1 hypothetical protein [Flavobacteriales bacterium]